MIIAIYSMQVDLALINILKRSMASWDKGKDDLLVVFATHALHLLSSGEGTFRRKRFLFRKTV